MGLADSKFRGTSFLGMRVLKVDLIDLSIFLELLDSSTIPRRSNLIAIHIL
jgi:hypothetical protein